MEHLLLVTKPGITSATLDLYELGTPETKLFQVHWY